MKINTKKANPEKQEADKLKQAVETRKHTEKLRELDLDRQGIEHSIDTLKAINKNNLINLVFKPFTKTKKLTKSFFRKAINMGHNLFINL